MNKLENHKLDIFIAGELVDLVVPTTEFAKNSNWYSWFNDKEITRFLEQGTFANTSEKQLQFFENISSDRFLLVIADKNGRNIGVISLSFINHRKKCCDIALVVSKEGDKSLKSYISLEAMALMTSHAFDMLDMKRINAGQHIGLARWQSRLELIGYKLEGLHINKFKKGREISDSVTISASSIDYSLLCEKRNGNLWDGYNEMQRRIKNFPERTYLNILQDLYNKERKEYYKNISNL